MIDQPQASKLAKEAFDQWIAGDLEQSRCLYEVAIPLADPMHWALSSYHGEYACVLNELGHHEQATAQLKNALEVELSQGRTEGSQAVIIARYFLATQLLRHGLAEQAFRVLTPSIDHAPSDWLTLVAKAHILFALGRKSEAKDAAALAIANAPNPEKAEGLKQNLEQVFGDQDTRSLHDR